MKYLKSYNKIFEAKQVGIIYHYTNEDGLRAIINDGYNIKDTKKRGYISFTRDGNLPAGTKFGNFRIALDGDKMSNKFKIKPDSLAKKPGGDLVINPKTGNPWYKIGTKKQAEERIYLPNIKVKPFILSVDIVYDLDDDTEFDIVNNMQLAESTGFNVNKYKDYFQPIRK